MATDETTQSAPIATSLACSAPFIPPPGLPDNLGPARLEAIVLTRNKWVNGTVLHYHFLAHPDWTWPEPQKQVVRDAFARWQSLGIGLVFAEVADAAEAEIRIGREQNNRSWSYVGTDNLQFQDKGRTMNFGWDLTTPWGRATALHEIGHALGMPHEHQNPLSGIVWNEAAVLAAYRAPPNNWTEKTIRENILRALSVNEVTGSPWDPQSVMHYPFAAGLIRQPAPFDTTGIGENIDLSAADQAWVRRLYPPAPALTPIGAMQLVRLDAESGDQRDFVFQPTATRRYRVQMVGTADCRIVVFEQREGEPRYLTADDDAGVDANATIRIRFVRGRKYIIRVRVHFIAPDAELGLLLA